MNQSKCFLSPMLAAAILSLSTSCLFAAEPLPKTGSPATATNEPVLAEWQKEYGPAHDQRMKWWREARFGMFIHWGVYSVPAGTYHGEQSKHIGEWIMRDFNIPVAEYAEYAKHFNPVEFNADEIVGIAKNAGMKYIVITAKHHDGFAMFHSKASAFNIYDATPFKRDPLKELSEACARHGIKFGFYYSQAQDWHEPNGNGNTWDFGPEDKKDFDQYLRAKAEPQVKELLSHY